MNNPNYTLSLATDTNHTRKACYNRITLPKKLPSLLLVISLLLTIPALGLSLSYYRNSRNSYQSVINSVQPDDSVPVTISKNPAASHPPITSIEQVFDNSPDFERTAATTTLLATGDVLTARSVNYRMTQFNDFTWPFHNTAEFVKTADIAFINLETPLIDGCPVRNDGMLFCGNLRSVEGLLFAGIDVVNLANNHASNQGREGVNETVITLKNAGLLVSGVAGNNASFTIVKDTKFAFLGYNEVNEQEGITRADDVIIINELQAARSQADIVVVQFHWGNEYTYTPSENQKRLAHLAIDNGADIIIGNHPHWIQPLEFYNGKLIIYSHGNFVFDQMWSLETRQGIVGEYTFANKALVDVDFTPVLIENYGQPRILEGEEAQKILTTLERESRKIAE